jgi:Cytochrome c
MPTRLPVLVTAALLAVVTSAPGRAESPLERGTYLMNAVAGCGNCHSPFTAEGPTQPELSGGPPIVTPAFTAYPRNLTPDPATGIGTWTDDQIVAAVREGRRPDGSVIRPPMPIDFYRGISDTDIRTLVAYLRSVPAVEHKVPDASYKFPPPAGYGPPLGPVPDVPRTDPVAYGAYLGRMAHCLYCHTPLKGGARDYEHMPGAGGLQLTGPWGTSVSANITPDPETGIGAWTDQQVKDALAKGVRPDGSRLAVPMPVYYFRNMTDDDLTAVVAWLRTLRPIRNVVHP